jgi:hypothetical protein
MMNLKEVTRELATRLSSIFLPDAGGQRPCHGGDRRYADDPHWRDLLLFHEYFHGDTGRGCGASHQTGWTGLIAQILIGLGEGYTANFQPPERKPASSKNVRNSKSKISPAQRNKSK